MGLIERERLLAEYDKAHVGPPGGARKLIEEAPEVKPGVVAEIKIDNDVLQRMVSEAVEEIKAELFGSSEQLDAIRVVRCKDCRFRDKPHMSSAWLPCVDMKVPDDFYCARGEWE